MKSEMKLPYKAAALCKGYVSSPSGLLYLRTQFIQKGITKYKPHFKVKVASLCQIAFFFKFKKKKKFLLTLF